MRLSACLFALALLAGCADAERLIRDTVPDGTSAPTAGTPPGSASPGSSSSGWPPTPAAAPIDASGTWDTSWGAMTLRQEADGRVTGTYENGASQIDARNTANTIEGYWIEPTSTRRCDTARGGSVHWGRVQFVLVERDRWVGKYTYCDGPVGRSAADWDGTR